MSTLSAEGLEMDQAFSLDGLEDRDGGFVPQKTSGTR